MLGSNPEGVCERVGWKRIERNTARIKECIVDILQSTVHVPYCVHYEIMLLTKEIGRVESVKVGVGDVVASAIAVVIKSAFAYYDGFEVMHEVATVPGSGTR